MTVQLTCGNFCQCTATNTVECCGNGICDGAETGWGMTCVYICMYVFVCICICECVYIRCVYICMCLCVYVHVSVYIIYEATSTVECCGNEEYDGAETGWGMICIYIYMYVFVCICIWECIYIYTRPRAGSNAAEKAHATVLRLAGA